MPHGDVELEDPCGCPWPGLCRGYGSRGCAMKAEERLHVAAERVGPAPLVAGAIGRGLADAAAARPRED